MKPRVANQKTAALTLVEVLVVIAVLAVLVVYLLPALNHAKVKAQCITCNGELKLIALSFKIWEGDHTNHYQMSISTNLGGTFEYIERGDVFRHFQVMSNELSASKTVVCPADVRRPAKDFGLTLGNTNISYFVGVDADDSNPQMLISGDRNIVGGIKLENGIVEITTNQLITWSSEMHDGVGNIAFTDGSVQQTTSSSLRELIVQTGLATNRLAIP